MWRALCSAQGGFFDLDKSRNQITETVELPIVVKITEHHEGYTLGAVSARSLELDHLCENMKALDIKSGI